MGLNERLVTRMTHIGDGGRCKTLQEFATWLGVDGHLTTRMLETVAVLAQQGLRHVVVDVVNITTEKTRLRVQWNGYHYGRVFCGACGRPQGDSTTYATTVFDMATVLMGTRDAMYPCGSRCLGPVTPLPPPDMERRRPNEAHIMAGHWIMGSAMAIVQESRADGKTSGNVFLSLRSLRRYAATLATPLPLTLDLIKSMYEALKLGLDAVNLRDKSKPARVIERAPVDSDPDTLELFEMHWRLPTLSAAVHQSIVGVQSGAGSIHITQTRPQDEEFWISGEDAAELRRTQERMAQRPPGQA